MENFDDKAVKSSSKNDDLQRNIRNSEGQPLTTNQGVLINDDQNTLKAGSRGPSLVEDFIAHEKLVHFDHERIPERVVHARGSGAHGIFELYKPLAKYTKAKFLNDTSKPTPVFVRFSTVVGSRGSSDLVRDVRGFSVKFYTDEGNYDLVGNNIPVFFIQDAIKFPDLVHAIKPEPHNEMPQASSAHDTFWDFMSIMPETTHMIMWLMSDRTIPRSFRMMEGFGVHTFRFINAQGESHFVKFHWKPLLGVHSVAWDEAQNISGKDPDFHRRDLWEAINSGTFPEWELGVQIIPEADELKFDFDLLDATKLIPEELVPVQRIGKMTLNKNPDNFFAETEQVGFNPGRLVPGIDFSNDPLLQGRIFSYTDTQLNRLGSPNFHEIPINRPIIPVHNNQRDGRMRQTISSDITSYNPNTISNGCPFQSKIANGGFNSFGQTNHGNKERIRSDSFFDHFSQAKLFYNSQSTYEKNHIIDAFTFELGKVERRTICERVLGILSLVDKTLAINVANGLGLDVPAEPFYPINHGIPADATVDQYEPANPHSNLEKSAALSMKNTPKSSIISRCIAIIATDGVNEDSLLEMQNALEGEGATTKIVAPKLGYITSTDGTKIKVDKSFLTTASVLFDAIFIPDGEKSVGALGLQADAIHFIDEAFKHRKAIALNGHAIRLLNKSYLADKAVDEGLLIDKTAEEFVAAIAKHRFWDREKLRKVPA